MTPTDLRQNFLPVKRVGLHYTHFRNHLPLFMRLPGSQNPKNCQNSHRVAKVGLARISHGPVRNGGRNRDMKSAIQGPTRPIFSSATAKSSTRRPEWAGSKFEQT